MSLAFLAKKSWHTANFKNVEKVWIAEQKNKEEEGRLAELQKQIAEEREQQELRELQRRSGHGGKVAQEKVGWMYDGPMATCADTADDHLLGKAAPQALKEAPATEVKQLASGAMPGSLYTNTRAADDSFSRVHEDPLLAMRQQEIEARKRVLQNPRQMQRLRAAAESGREAERTKRRERKKEKKKEKKERKKEKKREKKERKRARKGQRKSGDGGGGSSSSSCSDDDHDGDSSNSDRGNSSHHGSRSTTLHATRVSSSPRAELSSMNERSRAGRPALFEKKAGYGLVGGMGQRSSGSGGGDRDLGPRNLGPSAVVLEGATRSGTRRGGAGTDEARKRVREQPRAPLTAQERQARLAEMAADADVNEDLRVKRVKKRVAAAEAEATAEGMGGGRGRGVSGGGAAFLRDMEKDVYLKDGASMAERVQTTRFYQQRDTGSDGFHR